MMNLGSLVRVANLEGLRSALRITHAGSFRRRRPRKRSQCRRRSTRTTPFLAVLGRVFDVKLAKRGHLDIPVRGLRGETASAGVTGLAANIARLHCLLGLACSRLLLGVCCRFWQELFEILQQIGSSVEKLGHLSINILNRLRLALVRL